MEDWTGFLQSSFLKMNYERGMQIENNTNKLMHRLHIKKCNFYYVDIQKLTNIVETMGISLAWGQKTIPHTAPVELC